MRIGRVKEYLATVDPGSWHYKLITEELRWSPPKKACHYFWVTVPGALLNALAFMVMLYLIVVPIGWFFGFSLDNREESRELFLDYKEKADGTEKKVLPWQVASVIGASAAIYYSVMWLLMIEWKRGLGWITHFFDWGPLAMIAGAMIVLALTLYSLVRMLPSIVRTWPSVRHGISTGWDKACPNLIVKPKE